MCSLEDISLKFFGEQIDDEGTKDLLRCLGKQKGLESLFLGFEKCNMITEPAMMQFLSVISAGNLGLKNFMLYFIGCKKNLTDYSLGKLGIAIANLKRLEILALNFSQSSQITDKGISNLAMRLGNFENLKKLVLVFRDCINIKGTAISENLFKELEKLDSLELLILDFKLCKRLNKEELIKALPCSGDIKYKLLVYFQ